MKNATISLQENKGRIFSTISEIISAEPPVYPPWENIIVRGGEGEFVESILSGDIESKNIGKLFLEDLTSRICLAILYPTQPNLNTTVIYVTNLPL